MTETKTCRTCGIEKELNDTNFVPVTKQLVNGDIGHYFTSNCRLCYNLHQRATDGVNAAIKKPLHHSGPKPGSAEHKFFCR